MRQVSCNDITKNLRDMCIESTSTIAPGMAAKFAEVAKEEKSRLGRFIFAKMQENLQISETEVCPVCQDTGFPIVLIEIGQDVQIVDGILEDAINAGIAAGYTDGYLRKSMLGDPLFDRKNSNDNTPALITYNIVAGDGFKMRLMAKGGGSENVGAVAMLKPSDGIEGVKKFVVHTISEAGGAPCPPVLVGVGIGATMDKVAMLSKKALLRDIGSKHHDPRYAALEEELLNEINATGIGPQGLGGSTTAIGVHIEDFPTHMACLPVAVSVFCSAAHLATREL